MNILLKFGGDFTACTSRSQQMLTAKHALYEALYEAVRDMGSTAH
jgi:hypothetical protein